MSISLLLVFHGSDEQLRQFVDLISTPHPDKDNIWIDFLSQNEREWWRRHRYASHYVEMLRDRWEMEREMGYREDKKEYYGVIEYWIVDFFLHFVKNKLSDTILKRLVCKDAIDVAKSKWDRELATVLKKYVNDKYLET